MIVLYKLNPRYHTRYQLIHVFFTRVIFRTALPRWYYHVALYTVTPGKNFLSDAVDYFFLFQSHSSTPSSSSSSLIPVLLPLFVFVLVLVIAFSRSSIYQSPLIHLIVPTKPCESKRLRVPRALLLPGFPQPLQHAQVTAHRSAFTGVAGQRAPQNISRPLYHLTGSKMVDGQRRQRGGIPRALFIP